MHVWGIGQRVEWSAQAREGRKGGRGRGGRGRERFLRLLYLSSLNSWWPLLRGTGPPNMGLWSTYSCAHARVCVCVSRDSPPVCEACCVLPLQIYIGAALPELAFKPDSIYIPALEGGRGWDGRGWVGSEGVGGGRWGGAVHGYVGACQSVVCCWAQVSLVTPASTGQSVPVLVSEWLLHQEPVCSRPCWAAPRHSQFAGICMCYVISREVTLQPGLVWRGCLEASTGSERGSEAG